ncbi:MAG: eukaryotic-like serine/threonine-protein kinase, partial [Blastocatellia bacterium]
MIQARECGNWTILSLLGEGGMGEVFLARHKYLGTPGAVKGLSLFLTRDEKFRDRFLQEAQMQAQLRHPHIAPVLDYIVEHDQSYLVIEYLSGGSFADLIERSNSPLDQGQALTWIRQALAALDYAHQRGVIHRDIKPSNIMLDEHGNAKVVD